MRILTIQEMEQVGGAGKPKKVKGAGHASSAKASSAACQGGSSNKTSSGAPCVPPGPTP